MTAPTAQMKLFVSIANTGSHPAGWRDPGAYTGPLSDFGYFKDLAQKAELESYHGLFFADNLAMGDCDKLAEISHMDAGKLDPLTLISGLAVVTQRIGLVVTLSTSFNEPFNVARRFASIDHLSGGRVAWNIVTSASEHEARNFGTTLPKHDVRYERAQEFVDVVTRLWDSWEDDAFLRDQNSGRYFDPAKVHPLRHEGPYFSVTGPGIVGRPPQGHPVLVQAGSSGDGRRFAARNAELIYMAFRDPGDAAAYRADVRAQAAALGRDPDRIAFIQQFMPILGADEAAAQQRARELAERVPYALTIRLLQQGLGGVDLSAFPADGPLPTLPVPEGAQGGFGEIVALAKRENLSIRQLAARYASTRGVVAVVGTPVTIADTMERWFRDGAADGFMLALTSLPSGLSEFNAQVLPLLRQRGLFRSAYEGATLRENLGLDRPANAFAQCPSSNEERTMSGATA